MKIFLVCNRDGYVLDVILEKSFKRAYEKSIGSNNGEFLVEVDEQVFNLLAMSHSVISSEKQIFS